MNSRIQRILNGIKERSFSEEAIHLSEKMVLIYGAGGFGMEMLHHLQIVGIQPKAFLDKNAKEIKVKAGLTVYCPETAPFPIDECVVLFCIVMDRDQRKMVIRWLKSLGYHSIIEGQALRVLLVQYSDRREESLVDYWQDRLELIGEVGKLFEDDFSKSLYEKIIYAHMMGDYTRLEEMESPMAEQYFPSDIELAKGYQRFVDCGGYVGDTIEQLMHRVGRIDACAVFEPDGNNYIKMAERISGFQQNIGSRWLFPCAVNDTAAKLKFASATGSGTLSAAGEETVQTISLDMAIPDFHPTFIKMDIEGAELSALQGAKNLISVEKPDLAVCTYHAVNHIWDIPKLLHTWDLGYHFNLRSYNACTMETVLYASVREGRR